MGKHMNRYHSPRRGALLSEAWWDCCPRSAPYGDSLLDELNDALQAQATDDRGAVATARAEIPIESREPAAPPAEEKH